jgi:hypothetical protein
VDHFEQQARELQLAVQAGGSHAAERVSREYLIGLPTDVTTFALSAARIVIAREYGFPSWPRLRQYVEAAPPHPDKLIVAALNGDLDTIDRLVASHPEIIDRAITQQPNLITRVVQTRRSPAAVVACLAELGFDVNALDEPFISAMSMAGTALHFATVRGDQDTVRVLIAHGADPEPGEHLDG